MSGSTVCFSLFQYQPLHEGLREHPAAGGLSQISIPAPPRGASTARDHQVGIDAISIPAPPRGASVRPSLRRADPRFQYQPLHEGLPWLVGYLTRAGRFQYQPLHEGLPVSLRACWYAIFQYQPLHEGLHRAVSAGHLHGISIPAPPRGASMHQLIAVNAVMISIPAPPRGASMHRQITFSCRFISIPAPPRGASKRYRDENFLA